MRFDGAYFIFDDGSKDFIPEKALQYLLEEDIVFINSYWWIKGKENQIGIFVNCNDVFAWGCADAEDLHFDELENLYNFVKNDPKNGSTIWCCLRRKEIPQELVRERIEKDGKWNFKFLQEEFGLEDNYYDTAYDQYELQNEFKCAMEGKSHEN